MLDNPSYSGIRHPMLSILLTLLIIAVGFQIVGPIIGLIFALPLYEGSVTEFAEAIKSPFDNPSLRVPLLIMQGFGTLFGMILIPILFLRAQQRSIIQLFTTSHFIQPVFIVIVLVIVFMGVNSVFIEWNKNISFPGDEIFRNIEENLAKGTKFLTTFNSIGDVVFAFIVIAVIPAIGEELVFRGMIQNDLYRLTRNPHAAIWLAAIIFSAFHIQFFGFVPRMLLGAMFGYLYYWSGNLWLAVLAHFVNNGFTVIGLYLYQKGVINVDLEGDASVPWQAVAFSAVFSTLLLYSFKMFYNRHAKTSLPE